MTAQFNPERGETSRTSRLLRVEIAQAKRDVEAGRAQRVSRPGVWRVFREADGAVVVEVFP